jgi:arsenite methyltransferase
VLARNARKNNLLYGVEMNASKNDELRKRVGDRYKEIATSSQGCCCGSASSSSCCGGSSENDHKSTSSALGYSDKEMYFAPDGSNLGLGCGNPQAIANLKKGDTVLDLGSGAGFDCFLAAKQVGESGCVIGVDMTPEMVSLARANAEKGGFTNVEFRLGEIENLPVKESSIDVIISNCVVNLSPEKSRVFAEAYRVLKPGGRLAISDVIAMNNLPDQIKNDISLYAGCIAGAMPIDELNKILEDAGFINIKIAPKDESKEFIKGWAPNLPITDFVVSAEITGEKKS